MTTPCQQPRYQWAFDAAIEYERGPGYRRAVELCQEACEGCPIRAECLRDNPDQPGVIAGYTLEERGYGRPATQQRRQCGTKTGSATHYKHGEMPCEPCRTVNNEARQARREERRGQESAA